MAELIGLLSWPPNEPVDLESFSQLLSTHCSKLSQVQTYYIQRLPILVNVEPLLKKNHILPGYVPEECTPMDFVRSEWQENCVLFCPWEDFTAAKAALQLDPGSVLVLKFQGTWRQFPLSDLKPQSNPGKVHIDLAKLFSPLISRQMSSELPEATAQRQLPPREERKEEPPFAERPMEHAKSTILPPIIPAQPEKPKVPVVFVPPGQSTPDRDIAKRAQDQRDLVARQVKELEEDLKTQVATIEVKQVRNEGADPGRYGAFVNDQLSQLIAAKEQEIRTLCSQAIASVHPTAQQCAEALAKCDQDYQSLVAAITQQMNQQAAAVGQLPVWLTTVMNGPELQTLSEGLTVTQQFIEQTSEILDSITVPERYPFKALTALTRSGPVLLIRWKSWQPGDVKIIHFDLTVPEALIDPQWVVISSGLEVVPYTVSEPAGMIILEGESRVLTKNPVTVTNAWDGEVLEWDVGKFRAEQTAILDYYVKNGYRITAEEIDEIKTQIEASFEQAPQAYS